MKAKHFKKVKRLMLDSNWLLKKLKFYGECEKNLGIFYSFECNHFFKGETLADYNRTIHSKMKKKLNVKIKAVKKALANIGIEI